VKQKGSIIETLSKEEKLEREKEKQTQTLNFELRPFRRFNHDFLDLILFLKTILVSKTI
jgi:hypothetical protein